MVSPPKVEKQTFTVNRPGLYVVLVGDVILIPEERGATDFAALTACVPNPTEKSANINVSVNASIFMGINFCVS